jgi:hypothetical protein
MTIPYEKIVTTLCDKPPGGLCFFRREERAVCLVLRDYMSPEYIKYPITQFLKH